jgi:hypothetical protein
VQDHQPTASPDFGQLQRLCSHKAAPLEGLADELAGVAGELLRGPILRVIGLQK